MDSWQKKMNEFIGIHWQNLDEEIDEAGWCKGPIENNDREEYVRNGSQYWWEKWAWWAKREGVKEP